MAILKGNLDFTGSMGSMSAYKRRDLDKTILREKGGGSKEKIYNAPSCQNIRHNFTEFSLCGKMGGSIRRSMFPMLTLADYNFTPKLTSIAKILQKLDTESKKGERNVLLSQHKHLLAGFSLNRKTTFEHFIRASISCSIDRLTGSAIIKVPSLVPGVNLSPWKPYSFYRIIVNLGCVKDKKHTIYFQPKTADEGENTAGYSSWHSSSQQADEVELNLQLRFPERISDDTTLILSAGIQFGTALTDSIIEPVKYAGAAKIIATG